MQQRLTIHMSRTVRGEKKVACVMARICECFACGVAERGRSREFTVGRIAADQLPVLLSFLVPYSNEFKRAIDSAILRCSSANPAFRNAIAPVSSDCMADNLARSASCS